MASGVVSRFNAEKGWGFIRPHDGGDDVMLHVRELRDQRDASRISPGVVVMYAARQTERGLRATDVRLDGGDALPAAQFRDEVASVLAAALEKIEDIARRHGWMA